MFSMDSKIVLSLIIFFALVASIVGVLEFHYWGHPPFILIPICVCSVFITAIVGTITGFGASIIVTPLFFLIFDVQVFLVSIILNVVLSFWAVFFFRQYVNIPVVFWFAVPALLSTMLGSFFLVHTPLTFFTHMLGGFLAFYGIFMVLYHENMVKISYKTVCGGGTIAGFLEGFFGIKDVVRSAVLLSYGLEAKVFIATNSAISTVIGLGKLFIYYVNGIELDEGLGLVFLFTLVTFAGVWVGKKMMDYVDQQFFTKIVSVAIALFGLYLMTSSEDIVSIITKGSVAAVAQQ
jgi:uncharacterized protein